MSRDLGAAANRAKRQRSRGRIGDVVSLRHAVTGAENEFVVHEEPVWRDRADFIISAALRESDLPKRFEQLWVRQVADDEFEVCCVPFFLYDIALGDVVRTSARGDRRYVVERVVVPSGRFVFRVWFGDSFFPRDAIATDLVALGAQIERSSVNLLAVDTEDQDQAQAVADYLATREARGELKYETGQTA